MTPSAHDPFSYDDQARKERLQLQWWRTLGVLYRWRRFIVIMTVLVAVLSVVLTLMMQNRYRASASLLLPESSGGLSSALLANLPSAASSLLGTGGGDYIRYLAILNSRTVMESVVDSFGLIQLYELEDEEAPREEAVKTLRDYAEFEYDLEFEYLVVSVLDTDRQRAADMANHFVRKLNEINIQLTSQSAGQYRQYVEQRYFEARAAIDSVLDASRQFQQQYGLYDLPAQTQAYFEQIAAIRADALQAEIQYEALRAQYGEENPQVVTLKNVADAANEKYNNALRGREHLLPVSREDVPDVVREYVSLEMERTLQTAILEIIGPMYEQARFQEEQEAEAVQVLDDAVPPAKKASPRRSIICILATLSAFLLSSLFALTMTWWKQNYVSFAGRLREASDEPVKEPSSTSLSE